MNSDVSRNARWRVGRFRMFLGTNRAFRSTMGPRRSLFDSAFAEDDNFARMSPRASHSLKVRIVGFMDILLYEMGELAPPAHAVMEIYLLICQYPISNQNW